MKNEYLTKKRTSDLNEEPDDKMDLKELTNDAGE